MISGIPDRKFYVLFRKYDPEVMPFWWRIIFDLFIGRSKKKWGHVDIFFPYQEGVVTIISSPWQIGIRTNDMHIGDYLKLLKKHNQSACIAITSDTTSDTNFARGFLHLHCVSIVKSILGERGWYYHPQTLFKKLSNKGKILWQQQQSQ